MAAYQLIEEDHKTIVKLDSMEGVYLSSDHHFSHENIITYCNRPYYNASEMDQDMVLKWNEVVQPEDLVLYLGDFSLGMGPLSRVRELNGTKILKAGNHDKCFWSKDKDRVKSSLYIKAGFFDVILQDFYLDVGEMIRLDHFPYKNLEPGTPSLKYDEFRPLDDGKKLLHGHVHNRWKVLRNMVDVGVDSWGMRPVSLKDALAVFG